MSIVKNIFFINDDTDDQEFFIEAISGLKNINLSGMANNGTQAINMLNNCILLPDFIFIDFNMPFINGIEVLRMIKKLQRIKGVPVFMLSSAIEQSEVSRKLGAKGFIKRCDDITALQQELHRVINTITDETKSPAFRKQVMKKNQKKIAVNNQDDGEAKVYTLYPENAIADTNHKKQMEKQNADFETALKVKELHNLKSINQSSLTQSKE